MGFNEVAVAEPYAGLLERGQDTLEDYLNRVRSILGTGEGKNRGAIVMNCNPFTLGHRSLVEYAVNNCDEVIILLSRKIALYSLSLTDSHSLNRVLKI